MKLQLFFIITCLTVSLAHAEMATINGSNVNLRKGPGVNYGAEWKYGKGVPVRIIKKQNDWVKVQDFEGETGWIFHSLLHKEPRVIVKIDQKSNPYIHIRKRPTTKSKIIGQAANGVIFSKKSEHDEWVEVEHDTGLEGWIKKEYVWGY